MNNHLLKVLCSLPVVLLTLYFIPFVGVVLTIMHYFVYRKNKWFSQVILIIGIFLFISSYSETPYQFELYVYGKRLIATAIFYIILYYSVNTFFEKFKMFVKSYIQNEEKQNQEVKEKNDLIMQEKREKAKNTSVVYCPFCGADNLLTDNTGTCKYCRRKINKH